MTLKSFLALSIFAIVAASGDCASAQANVVENQTTYLYVDAKVGSDSNSGAQSTPFKTITAAVNKANSLNQQGIGVKVIVNSGVYREQVNIGNYKSTSATLTIQAAVTGGATIAGSDLVAGWVQENATTWQAPFSHTTNFCAIPSGWPTTFAPMIQRTEMVFVNGTPLTQVIAYNQLRPGTFFFSDTYQLLHIAPPSGTNMSTAVVEAASRATTLWMGSRSNVVLRGLAFRHAANCINSSGVSINSSNNVLIDSVQANWNNWGGLGIYSSTNITLQNSVANNNGGVGFMGNKDQNLLLSFNESDYNNWRGAQGAFYDWGMGGTKYFQTHNATVQNHFSYNNQAQGLWFDTDNQNITIKNATLSGNVQAALQIERDEGPVTLQNSLVCSSGAGVNVLTSTGVTIQNNTFYNNGGKNIAQAEIFVAGQAGGKIITDWVTGQSHNLFTTGMVLSGNTFQNATPGQLVFGTYLAGTDWTQFASTLKSTSNTWYDPNTAIAFKIVNGKVVALSAWQSAVQTDYSSVWQAPATSATNACQAPTPTFADFNINVNSNNYTMASGNAVATIRINSFGYGPVTLKAEGMPAGVSAAFSQGTLASGVVTLTFTSTSTAAAQTVPITLFGVSGSRVHSAAFYLHVNPL
jgi:hypothetical protein